MAENKQRAKKSKGAKLVSSAVNLKLTNPLSKIMMKWTIGLLKKKNVETQLSLGFHIIRIFQFCTIFEIQ